VSVYVNQNAEGRDLFGKSYFSDGKYADFVGMASFKFRFEIEGGWTLW
jgi:hypothetical protein